MKTIFVIFLILSMTNIAFAKKIKYSRVICNQKNLPLKIEQSLNAHLLSVKFTAKQKISNFSLKNIRGIDGVTVLKFQEVINQKLESGETLESAVELSDFGGLVYVVFDVALTVNGVSSEQSIPVALGKLSQTQKNLRSKNIKEVKTTIQQKEGSNAITLPPKKIHEMKLE
jgi:hypothetical protein